ncbi:MAG: glycosyltransferase 87 family protein [Chthoniobacterales bacterium]
MNPVQSIDFAVARSSHEEIGFLAQSRRYRNLWIVGFGLMGLMLKLVIAFNTFGSTDAVVFYTFAKALSKEGLEFTYRHSILFNHPPLTAHYLQLIFYLDHQAFFQASGLTFPVLLRLPGILADFVVLLVLLEIPKKHAEITIPTWALALFALSPVSLMVSGFHGNTDPIMVMFLVLACYMCLRNKPALSGLFLALSCQIKIVPLLFVPIFFFFWYYRGIGARFLLPFALGLLLSWSEALSKFPALFIKNVLSYSGFWGIWGITYWLRLTGLPEFKVVNFFHLPVLERVVITILKLVIIAAVLLIAWRRRKLSGKRLFDSLAYAWIIFFVFAPSVSVQYLVWLAPFVLVLSPVFYGWLAASSSLFLFFFYNVTAGGFPWYFAMSTNELNTVWTPWSLWPWLVLIAGLVVLWHEAKRANPSLRLFSLRPVNA